jgi:hypothetical protein
MEENVIIRFFKKIHLSIVDSNYLANEVLNTAFKSVFWFFFAVLMLSLSVSAISRSVKISKYAPEAIVSTVGVLQFENYRLISPDSIKQIEGWRLKEVGALVSGIRVPQSVEYPASISVGTDEIDSSKRAFIHIGETAFSSNVLASIFGRNKSNNVQQILWTEVLSSPNIIVDEGFYIAQFGKIQNIIGIFFAQQILIGLEFFGAILQIWLSLMIYLLFFGKNLKLPSKFRLLMLATIPYFIIMPISLAAANGILFTTDIALVAALIITIRAVTRIESSIAKKENYEAL